jgi:hypothetical protein
MNERIKKLAEQAKIEFTYDPTETPMRAFVEAWEDDLEKFAELIVGECYLWAKENGGLGCEEDFEALKEHFGVKE